MNSFILTSGGLSILIDGTAYTVDRSHVNYDQILDAVRSKQFNSIPALLNTRNALTKAFDDKKLELQISNDTVSFRGNTLSSILRDRLIEMFRNGFDMTQMDLFLKRLYANPSKKTVDELFAWISVNGITISEDGYLYAYKRVQDDFTSFHDSTTLNNVGTWVAMPRNAVDDRSDNTCSSGLHFCSQSYLPKYSGGQGQVLLLKIDPADVVSIPTDYNLSKGRACRYFVEAALSGDARVTVERSDVLKQAVVREAADINESNTFKASYILGYKDGRGKQKKFKSFTGSRARPNADELDGYEKGYIEGRAKQPRRFV